MISVLVVTSYYKRLMIVIMNALGHILISVTALTGHVNYTLVVCRHTPGFLKLHLSATSVCVCVSTPEAINYIHDIFNLYNQLNKFVAFRNVMNAWAWPL